MAEQTSRMHGAESVVLDAAGTGHVWFGPDRPLTRWLVERISVTVSSNTLEPEARVYRDSIDPTRMLSGTFSGSNDTDDALNQELYPGERLYVEWTGGDPGARATAAYFGQHIAGML